MPFFVTPRFHCSNRLDDENAIVGPTSYRVPIPSRIGRLWVCATNVGRKRSSIGPDLAVHALVLEELNHSVRRLDELHSAERRSEKNDSRESLGIAYVDRIVGVPHRHGTGTEQRFCRVEKLLSSRRHRRRRFQSLFRTYPDAVQIRG